MAEQHDITREIEMDLTVPVFFESYDNAENAKQMYETAMKAAETELNKKDKRGHSDFDLTIEAEFDNYSDVNGNEVTREQALENPDDCFATLTVTVNGFQNGTFEEGSPSYDYYIPDDPADLVDTYDESDAKDMIEQAVAKSLNDFGLETERYNIENEDRSTSWDHVIENYNDPDAEFEYD